ncbi:MAG TPA: hypothetical protein PLA88_04010 [Bacteroidales bacterium]|nr:hypothetical protein [Bacteroidales bacterium]
MIHNDNNMFPTNILVIVLLLLFGCSKKHESYIGHWHYYDDLSGNYHSVTITDSSLIIDEFTYGGNFLIDDYDFNDNASFVELLTVKLNADKKVIGFEKPENWYKTENTSQDFLNDFSCNLPIFYTPDTTISCNPVHVCEYAYRIFAGKLKPNSTTSNKQEKLYCVKGYYVVINDHLGTKEYLIDYLSESERYGVVIYTSADCPDEIISDIVKYAGKAPIYRIKADTKSKSITHYKI